MSNGSERVTVVVGRASGIGWATARPLAVDHCRAGTTRSQGERLVIAGGVDEPKSVDGRAHREHSAFERGVVDLD
jgi:NAD(P)-dependent dehydrogenase (short-subunit alcohol dehydrogenase family)